MEIITTYRSPNYHERNADIDTIVIHYTDMLTTKDALIRLCDQELKVSAHYLIDTNGLLYSLVDEDKCAWHAGVSYWRNREGLNQFSIGIELANPGHQHGYLAFPDRQMEQLIKLCQNLMSKYYIKPINVVGHSDIAPSRKKDPGELFNWKLLAKHQIAIDHKINCPKNNKILYIAGDKNISSIQTKLGQFGYQINITDIFDQQTSNVIIAFRRRFIQTNLENNWDIYCQEIINSLL